MKNPIKYNCELDQNLNKNSIIFYTLKILISYELWSSFQKIIDHIIIHPFDKGKISETFFKQVPTLTSDNLKSW